MINKSKVLRSTSILKFKLILFKLERGQKRLGQKSDLKYKKRTKLVFW
ncbi:hypothetical protein HMPREF0813_01502 [Streptococcus anginosus F0211]|uniref:Uncharacterized protein n=1 Tax=Streptococcus anginosus F0211 TaxID=706437 RepID=E6J2L2_STRAP|nr:hypothetical protein HMPREF0813_01502 [Streptococcus anginosus F0211]